MAEYLGIGKRTYAGYERDEAEIGAGPLSRLVAEGWNANWLLTGEGPERLEAAFHSGSQDLSARELNIALELVNQTLESDGLWLPGVHYAEFVVLVLGKLREGWAYNRIRSYVEQQLERIAKGGTGAESGRQLDAAGQGATEEGDTTAPASTKR